MNKQSIHKLLTDNIKEDLKSKGLTRYEIRQELRRKKKDLAAGVVVLEDDFKKAQEASNV
tara:strand:- start:230 stop:409 length:180 start_codon:yes stop_codon:yes gene_type:complete